MWKFSLSNGDEFGKNIIIFEVDNSLSAHADSKKKDILILGKGPTNWLDDTTTTTEAEYSINFSEQGNKFCLYDNVSNSHLFVNGMKIYQFKGKDFEFNA